MTPLDRRQPPPPRPRTPFHFPAFESHRLDSGLVVLACRAPELPMVCLHLVGHGGADVEPSALPGLATLHAELLDEGTSRRDATTLARAGEVLGGGLQSGASFNDAALEMLGLARNLGTGLELLAECWLDPIFPEAEIERLRHEQLADLLRRQSQPGSLADDVFQAALYGDATYGRPLLGTAAALEQISRADLIDFHRRRLALGNSALVAVGAFDLDELLTTCTRLFGGATAPHKHDLPRIAPRPRSGLELHVVDRPGSSQTQLIVGQVALPRRNPDFPALVLLNSIFGGKFSSRINLNLRERHGITYGANSSIAQRRAPGPFQIKTAVASESVGRALHELIFELRRLLAEEIPEVERIDAQDYLIGAFASSVQTVYEVSHRLAALFTFGLPVDLFKTYPESIRNIDSATLLEVGRRYLDPERLVVVAVGEAEKLVPQLEDFGPVEVHAA
jgi:zinc protease